jgi:hypothetical protein
MSGNATTMASVMVDEIRLRAHKPSETAASREATVDLHVGPSRAVVAAASVAATRNHGRAP